MHYKFGGTVLQMKQYNFADGELRIKMSTKLMMFPLLRKSKFYFSKIK